MKPKNVVLIPAILIFFNTVSFAAISGDANDNGKIDLADVIILLQKLVGQRPNDTTPPTVSISSPSGNANVSGSVTLSADTTDNVVVAGVQFLLDGVNLGTEVTTAPFSTTWNSTQSSNGAHMVSARARDTAGNIATSGMVNVTVSNTGSPLQLELAPAITGFTTPLDLQAPADGSGRLFVVEQGGKIKIIQSDGTVLATPFLDIGLKLSSSVSEEGLLGLAFHPNFSTNGKFYVNYTSSTGGLHTVIAEFTATPANSNTASTASERILLTVSQPESNHNGGGLAFGNDNYLYIALGDGGGGGDNHGTIGNSQDTTTLLGKILRIGVDPPFASGLQYAIPPTNPFFGGNLGRNEIWLYGLRNPYRFSVDHATGDLWIGDVGQSSFEEVDRLTQVQGGANLGWRCREAAHNFNTATANCATATFTDPIFEYTRESGDTTVVGGYVYNGKSIPQLFGQYFFGDFNSGRAWTLTQNNQGQWVRTFQFITAGGDLSAFGQDQSGELYVVRYSSGQVARIRQVGMP